jgi:hypothetical protein
MPPHEKPIRSLSGAASIRNLRPVFLSFALKEARGSEFYHLGYTLIKAYHRLELMPLFVKVFIAFGPASLLNRKNGKELD